MRAVIFASASKFGLSAYAFATTLVLGVAFYGTPSDASEVSFKDFPYIIYCHMWGLITHIIFLGLVQTAAQFTSNPTDLLV